MVNTGLIDPSSGYPKSGKGSKGSKGLGLSWHRRAAFVVFIASYSRAPDPLLRDCNPV